MKPILALVLFLSAFAAVSQTPQITLEDIWVKYKFMPKYVPGFQFTQEDRYYTQIEEGKIIKYDVETGMSAGVFFEYAGKDVDLAGMSDYKLSPNGQDMLILADEEHIYRHSSVLNCYLYDAKSKSIKPIHAMPGKKISYPTFNHDGSKVAFCFENNIHIYDCPTGKTTQVTPDGAKNKIINGSTDWVYEEEFAFTRAFEWSPDGKTLAFIRFNETDVKEFTMEYHKNQLYPEPYTFKYPKAGEKNSTVQVLLYDIATQKTSNAEIGDDPELYIPRIQWTQDPGKLCVTRLNRHQNHLTLLLVDSKTGKSTSLLEEKSKYYVDVHDNLRFLKDGKQFLWTSEKDGFNHIYLYGMDGKETRQITKGNWDVTKVYGLDEKSSYLFFQSTEKSAISKTVACIGLDGKGKKALHKGDGEFDAEFSPNFEYYVLNGSSTTKAPSSTLFMRDGKLVRVLEDNSALMAMVKGYALTPMEFLEVPTTDGTKLNGWIIKPHNFDPKKKYPVLMYVYGGPGAQTVSDDWDSFNRMWFYMLAQKGYIVVSFDNRGTGGRGEAFKKSTYMQLGKLETEDQIAMGKWLANQPYVDASRIGIWGWSYGGYMSSLCILKGADIFKMAIAVAPVTNWKWYDTIYTERFLRKPEENEAGYEDNSPVNFTKLLKGKYLMIHGMADDNVHFQNAVEMANSLIKSNKQFDTYFYPNADHGIRGGTRRIHLFTKMTDYILTNL